jgi:hypothetical protein
MLNLVDKVLELLGRLCLIVQVPAGAAVGTVEGPFGCRRVIPELPDHDLDPLIGMHDGVTLFEEGDAIATNAKADAKLVR